MELKDRDFHLIDGWSGTPKLREPFVEIVVVLHHLQLSDFAMGNTMHPQCDSYNTTLETETSIHESDTAGALMSGAWSSSEVQLSGLSFLQVMDGLSVN